MPRQARIDAPGQYYHVMSRGIERSEIFTEEADYADFIERFKVWLQKSGGRCLAWCLMPNHFHFLLLRGQRPLSELMHHVMTGYAVNYNLRRHRVGHLFQNRYKSIVCGFDGYFMELVPYIHLNPLRAGLVADLAALRQYKWCGHASLVTGIPDGIIDKHELLPHFGGNEAAALDKYTGIMREKAREIALAAASGQRIPVPWADRAAARGAAGRRIADKDGFVEKLLRSADENMARARKEPAELLVEVSKLTGVAALEILTPSRKREPARARAIYCYLCKEEGGISGPELMAELKVNQSAVSKLIGKGRELVGTAIRN